MARILLPLAEANRINNTALTPDLPKAARQEISRVMQYLLGNSQVDRPEFALDKVVVSALTKGGKNSPLRRVKAAINRMPKGNPHRIILSTRHRAIQKACGA